MAEPVIIHKQALGAAIQERLEHLNMPRQVLLDQTLMSKSYLSELITGTKWPSLPVLVDIATVLHMTPSELLQRAESYGINTRSQLVRTRHPDPALPSRR